MAQQYVWPAISVTATNPSVGTTGSAAPTSATEIAGVGSGNLLTAVKIGQGTMAQSVSVAVASDQSAVPVSAASLPLPTGAATSANQTNGTQQTQIVQGGNTAAVTVANALKVDGSAVTQPVSGSVSVSNFPATQVVSQATASNLNATVVQPTGSNLHVQVDSSALPTGAATAANQATEITSLSTIATNTTGLNLTIAAKGAPSPADVQQMGVVTSGNVNPITTGSATSANSIPVVPASDWVGNSKLAGKSAVTFVRNDYTSVNVTTAAYTQLIASTPSAASEIFIFDSSGQTLKLAFGGVGVEVDQMLIVPGGNGEVPLAIPSGTRVSIKAVSATANTGEIDLNLYG